MAFLTNEKLTIVGAAGMIGSNMAQTAAMLKLTPNICLYDVYEPGLEGVAEEMRHCGFPGVHFTYTTDVKVAFRDSKYIISSGGAPRKLIYSGLRPSQVTTLAALDSIRLQSELTKHFKINQDEVQGCRTYGGHGEAMAVFASGATIQGQPLSEIIGTDRLSSEHWEDIKKATVQGGSNIIKLRGRSSFQSPAYVSVKMIEGAMGGEPFTWPAGRYVSFVGMDHIVMAMDTRITAEGAFYVEPLGTDEEMADLKKSYDHLCAMRQEVIDLGILPPIDKWGEINPNLR